MVPAGAFGAALGSLNSYRILWGRLGAPQFLQEPLEEGRGSKFAPLGMPRVPAGAVGPLSRRGRQFRESSSSSRSYPVNPAGAGSAGGIGAQLLGLDKNPSGTKPAVPGLCARPPAPMGTSVGHGDVPGDRESPREGRAGMKGA